jgi:hypothetical protein
MSQDPANAPLPGFPAIGQQDAPADPASQDTSPADDENEASPAGGTDQSSLDDLDDVVDEGIANDEIDGESGDGDGGDGDTED